MPGPESTKATKLDLLPNVDRWIGLSEAGRLTGLSDTTLRTWCDEGRIQAVRAAGRRLLPRTDVERIARERSGRPA